MNKAITEIEKRIYPFANIEVGDTFLYSSAPYMKIGVRTVQGKYCNMQVNAVSLLNGQCILLANSNKVLLIENLWKGFEYHEEAGTFEEETRTFKELRAMQRCENNVQESTGDAT